MKKILLTLIAGSMVLLTLAQDNNVKINFLNLTYGDVRLGYERALNENLSVQGNIGFLIPRKVPGVFFDESAVEDYGGTVDIKNRLTGYNLSLELRYYPGSKGAPKGFYLAPYFKHNSWNALVSADFSYDATQAEYDDLSPAQQETAVYNSDNGSRPWQLDVTGEFTGKIKQTGGGIMLGYQWLVNDKVSIDFNFFGLGVESDKVILGLKTDAVDVDYTEWEKDIKEGTQDFTQFGDVDIKVESDEIKVSLGPILLPSPRFGLSFGYAF